MPSKLTRSRLRFGASETANPAALEVIGAAAR